MVQDPSPAAADVIEIAMVKSITKDFIPQMPFSMTLERSEMNPTTLLQRFSGDSAGIHRVT
jgi:hypothetical protein